MITGVERNQKVVFTRNFLSDEFYNLTQLTVALT